MEQPPSSNDPQPAEASGTVRSSTVFYTLGIVIAVIGVLYLGQDVLIPFALAALLSFALAPLVTRLRRWGMPRVPAVLLVAVFSFAFLGAIATLVGSQLINLATNLPTYQQNIQTKLIALRAASGGNETVDRITELARNIDQEIERQAEAAVPRADKKAAVPMVRLQEPQPSTWDVFERVASPLLGPLGTAGLVVVLVVFMLLEREDLRDRLIRLLGRNLSITTEAMDEAARRVSRYLAMQALVNATYAVPIAAGLYLIGVPNALLWGTLAFLLRFIPYVGPVMAAVFPLALALAVDPGWTMLAWTLALFLTIELISNNLVEPRLYGASTGMSALAVIMAAIFWTVLWGPVGLFLATPLTVCLAVIGRYVPQLRFLDIMLGSAPALTLAERFYQRMLAGDPEEGIELAEGYLAEHSLTAFYDDIVRPALILAEYDRGRKALAAERRPVVTESFMRVIADLDDSDPVLNVEPDAQAAGEAEHTASDPEPVEVLCASGRNGLDLAAATVVAQLLEQRGVRAQVLPAEVMRKRNPARLNAEGARWVLVSFLGAPGPAQVRVPMRRLRNGFPHLKLALGLWGGLLQDKNGELDAEALSADFAAVTFAEAADRIAVDVCREAGAMQVAPVPDNESERLQALRRLGILDTPADEALDELTRGVAKAFGAPIALLTLVDEKRQYWKASTGLPCALKEAGESPRDTSVCGHVVAHNTLLVVEDVLKDRRFADNPFLRENGIRFYVGAPLRTAEGLAIGTLCVIDSRPRRVSEGEIALLQMLADQAMQMIERQEKRQLTEREIPAYGM